MTHLDVHEVGNAATVESSHLLGGEGGFGFQKLDGGNVAGSLESAVHAVVRGTLWLVLPFSSGWKTLGLQSGF